MRARSRATAYPSTRSECPLRCLDPLATTKEVCADAERQLPKRSGQRVVDHHQRPDLGRGASDLRYVDHVEPRVGWRLHPNQAGLRERRENRVLVGWNEPHRHPAGTEVVACDRANGWISG